MGLRRAKHVAWRKVGDETVLIHLGNKRVYVLNESGGFFWHNLDGDRGMDQILEGMGVAQDVDAAASLSAFERSLEEADLVDRNAEERTNARALPRPEFPIPDFVPPQLVWQQELRNFGQSCAFVSGQSGACDTVPTM